MANGNGEVKLVTHWKRAYQVFDALIAALRRPAYPYSIATAVYDSNTLPHTLKIGGKAESNFSLAVCCYMKGSIQSYTAFNSLVKLHDDQPRLFDPELVARQPSRTKALLAEELLKRRLNHIEESCRQWVDNFTKLHQFWGGDTRALFADADYETLCKRLICQPAGEFNPEYPHGFRGFREKMVSMLAFYLVRAKLVAPISMPIPIDFHAMRIIIANGLITASNAPDNYNFRTEKMFAAARELTQRYCRERKVDPTELCDATWFLSSIACRCHPGNKSIVPRDEDSRVITVVPKEISWTKQNIENYLNTCSQCPIEGTCRWLVPSANLYRLGKLQIRGPRGRPPQLALFDK